MAPWLSPACVNRTDGLALQPADVAALWTRYPTAPLDGPPGMPGGLTGAVQGDTVTLTWSPASGAPVTAYHVIAGSMPGAADLGGFAPDLSEWFEPAGPTGPTGGFMPPMIDPSVWLNAQGHNAD